MDHIYDQIGGGYRETRREDPRLARLIADAVGPAVSVVNVGAGTGSYEPKGARVVAVEPSVEMIKQRPGGAAPVLRAVAEALPLRDRSFVAGLAVLTIHHWQDWHAGLRELSRVARERVVLLTWDPASDGFWLVQDYFPEFLERDRERLPSLGELSEVFESLEVRSFPVPHDCRDGFLGAYWRRPAAYLDEKVRRGISSFAGVGERSALRRLDEDLQSGKWLERHGEILDKDQLDIGYRLLVGRPVRS